MKRKKQKPITFKRFKAAIECIGAHREEIKTFTKSVEVAFSGSFLFCTIGEKVVSELISLLQDVVEGDDWIEYFIYECDMGKKPLVVTLVDGLEIPMDSIESLWKVINVKG